MRQFHEAHALYFIVSGTVVVKQQYEDPISEIVEDKIIGTMEVGDLFGEVSLLHNIPRTATIETSSKYDLCKILTLLHCDMFFFQSCLRFVDVES